MTNDGKIMQSSDSAPRKSVTMVSKFEAYSFPAASPDFFFTET